MTTKFSYFALGVSALALVACGKKAEAEAAPPAESIEEATNEATPNITIPDAPANPIIAINAEKSAAFLAKNAKTKGTRTLSNGLQITTLTPGNGEKPGPTDIIRFHYVGKHIDGTTFDDSRVLDAPLVTPSYKSIPIPGVPDALAVMSEGEKAVIAVPPSLGFGEAGLPGVFEPNVTLLFELDVIEVVTEAEPERRAEIEAEQERLMEEARAENAAREEEARAAYEKAAQANKIASDAFLADIASNTNVTATPSGLKYEVLTNGGGGEQPNPWDKVKVHYAGTLPDGTPFDSSIGGAPAEFFLNQVIPGWTEGVGLMNVGDKYKFYIPPALGYGARGTPGGPIGPNQALIFEVELLDITPGVAPLVE